MDQVPMHGPDSDAAEGSPFPRGARTSTGRRALVVADEKISGEKLVGSVLGHLGSGVEEIFVVAPPSPGNDACCVARSPQAFSPPEVGYPSSRAGWAFCDSLSFLRHRSLPPFRGVWGPVLPEPRAGMAPNLTG
jgi:hypothetical protein